MNFGEQLKANIKEYGYTRPTPIQKYCMPLVHQGMDIMGCSPTGSGKTAAFLLPIMAKLSNVSVVDFFLICYLVFLGGQPGQCF